MVRSRLLTLALTAALLGTAAPALALPSENRGCPPAFEAYDLTEQLRLAEELGVPESEVLATLDAVDKNGDTVLCFRFLKQGHNIVDNRSAHG